jgi:hypothetical protein
MPSFDPIEFILDSDNGLSSAMDTGTLAAHDLIPKERGDASNQPFSS